MHSIALSFACEWDVVVVVVVEGDTGVAIGSVDGRQRYNDPTF